VLFAGLLFCFSQQLDSPFRESCLDALLERELKEGFAKRWGRSQLPPTYNLKKTSDLRPDVVIVPLDAASPRGKLIAFADAVGPMMQVRLRFWVPIRSPVSLHEHLDDVPQYDSPGFLKNTKQYRQFGLAAIEVAQLCLKVWRSGGLSLPDSVASLPSLWNSECVELVFTLSLWSRRPSIGCSPGRKSHVVTARDVYDAAVRWRQMSEPFDPVFYIDGLTRTAFEEGFGLQTPMVSGQNLVVRYYPQVPLHVVVPTSGLVDSRCGFSVHCCFSLRRRFR
jgi:hypothetical protein